MIQIRFKLSDVKFLKNLSGHNKLLLPLNCVFIENQAGLFPNNWEISDVVVEIRDFHQYVVKVDRSGSLTLQNCQFLHQFNLLVANIYTVSHV